MNAILDGQEKRSLASSTVVSTPSGKGSSSHTGSTKKAFLKDHDKKRGRSGNQNLEGSGSDMDDDVWPQRQMALGAEESAVADV